MFSSFRIISPSWNPSVASDPAGPYARRFIAYLDAETQSARVGLVDSSGSQVQPVRLTTGLCVSSLYQIIDLGSHPVAIENYGNPFPLDSLRMLPPLPARDVYVVVKTGAPPPSFTLSGYDPTRDPTLNGNDRLEVVTRPVDSLVPHGGMLFVEPGGFYEGEIGIIVGSKAFNINEREAWGYVWGFTILNGVNIKRPSHEKQNNRMNDGLQQQHPSFSMGPIAIPKECLSRFQPLEVHVNGVKSCEFATAHLITEIPRLINSVTSDRMLHPGDVIATQISALNPGRPNFLEHLKQGDIISVTMPGIGTLSNIIGSHAVSLNQAPESFNHLVHTEAGLTNIQGKLLNYQVRGPPSGTPIILIHGLGGSVESFEPLIAHLGLENTHTMHLVDLEGHGRSPTQLSSEVNVVSFAQDILGIFRHANITEHSGATIVAHSMGCLPAVLIAYQYPSLVKKLVLLGPPPFRLSEARKDASRAHAEKVPREGLSAALEVMLKNAGVSQVSAKTRPLSMTAVKLSILGQNPEGYAKAVNAFSTFPHNIEMKELKARLLIVTGREDQVCPPDTAFNLSREFSNSIDPVFLSGVGHWHFFEDPQSLAASLRPFICS